MEQFQKIAPLLLCLVMAACILILMITGARAYRKTAEEADAADLVRTASQYVVTRVRTAPSPSAVAVSEFGGCPALVIQDSPLYSTTIYVHDGWLMEACVVSGGMADPTSGTHLVKMEGMSFSLNNDLLVAEGTAPGGRTFKVEAFVPEGKGVDFDAETGSEPWNEAVPY